MRDVFGDQMMMMRGFEATLFTQNPEQATLYLKLMLEEMEEVMLAANPKGKLIIEQCFKVLKMYAEVNDHSNLVEMFDGAIDTLVVTLGFGYSLGLPMEAGWTAVHDTNMAKVDPATGRVRRREDGKVLKPEGWTPPDLRAVLMRLGKPTEMIQMPPPEEPQKPAPVEGNKADDLSSGHQV